MCTWNVQLKNDTFFLQMKQLFQATSIIQENVSLKCFSNHIGYTWKMQPDAINGLGMNEQLYITLYSALVIIICNWDKHFFSDIRQSLTSVQFVSIYNI